MQYPTYLDEINERYKNYPPHRADNLAANVQIVECCLGLSGEVGEVVDLIKKSLMYNQPLDQKKLLLELGDAFHYFIRLAHLNHISLPTIMDANAEKLRKRFPAGYTDEAAINKADQAPNIKRLTSGLTMFESDDPSQVSVLKEMGCVDVGYQKIVTGRYRIFGYSKQREPAKPEHGAGQKKVSKTCKICSSTFLGFTNASLCSQTCRTKSIKEAQRKTQQKIRERNAST